MDIKKFLKFRLPKWKNQKYVAWVASQKKQGEDCHHLLQRQYSDLFLVNISSEQHERIHRFGYENNEFEELFVIAIINISRFIDDKTK